MTMSRGGSEFAPAIERRRFLGLATLIPPAIASAREVRARHSGGNLLPASLARALHAYNEATVRKDVAVLASLVSDDYVLVNSDASVQDKRSYLADFAMRDFTLEPYELSELLYRMLGSVALTGGIFHLDWTQHGSRYSRTLRIAHVWVRDGGNWKIVYTQLTRVPG